MQYATFIRKHNSRNEVLTADNTCNHHPNQLSVLYVPCKQAQGAMLRVISSITLYQAHTTTLTEKYTLHTLACKVLL